jgi:hypothetical protein
LPELSPSGGPPSSTGCAARCSCSTPRGWGSFAVAGTQKALAFGLNPVMAALLGMLTGIGGGTTRDMLLTEVPTVLRADLYAVAALAGRGRGRDRRRVAAPVDRSDDRRRGPLLRAPVHGYSSRLASSDRRGRPLNAEVIDLSEQTVSPRLHRHPCPPHDRCCEPRVANVRSSEAQALKGLSLARCRPAHGRGCTRFYATFRARQLAIA